MRYLNKKEIVRINKIQVTKFGGSFVPEENFLNEENLDYLVEAIHAKMFGEPLYPEIYQKAGLYMYNIVCNHIFQDGNKRTGLQAAMIFLMLNGYTFNSSVNDELLIDFTIAVASGESSLEGVQSWFQENIIQKS
jgi:death-on-curing protein